MPKVRSAGGGELRVDRAAQDQVGRPLRDHDRRAFVLPHTGFGSPDRGHNHRTSLRLRRGAGAERPSVEATVTRSQRPSAATIDTPNCLSPAYVAVTESAHEGPDP